MRVPVAAEDHGAPGQHGIGLGDGADLRVAGRPRAGNDAALAQQRGGAQVPHSTGIRGGVDKTRVSGKEETPRAPYVVWVTDEVREIESERIHKFTVEKVRDLLERFGNAHCPRSPPSTLMSMDTQKLREAFNLFDRDGDGLISRAELDSVLKSVGANSTSEDEVPAFSPRSCQPATAAKGDALLMDTDGLLPCSPRPRSARAGARARR